jgi:hypothetical protein
MSGRAGDPAQLAKTETIVPVRPENISERRNSTFSSDISATSVLLDVVTTQALARRDEVHAFITAMTD